MNKKGLYNVYKTIMIIVITAFITFMLTSTGLYTYIKNGGKLQLLNTDETSSISSELSKYRAIIDEYYLGEINEEDLKNGAIKGYIAGLGDQYSEYISKEEMDEYIDDAKGNYVGVGIYMIQDKNTNKVKVLSPIKNSPAQKAGILPGDLIVSVNDKAYTADQMSEMSNDIKGEEGTEVKITIIRGTETKEFTLSREKIIVNPVESKVLEDKIGYIQFTSFDETTADDFKAKYNELKEQGIEYLIIDLRNNGGGMVNKALDIADFMTPKDSVLLYEIDKNKKEIIQKSKSDPIINEPVVVLTNEYTASSSEILVGALKDLGRAKIVGTRTYGKGVIQEILSIKDGSGIKITTSEYQTPNHNRINQIGIEPDVEVELPEDVENILDVPAEKDTQLQKAKEVVKQ